MAFQTLAFLGFLALTVLLCHALGRVRPSLGRAALLLGCLYFCWQSGWRGMAVLAIGAAVSFLAGPRRQGRRSRLLGRGGLSHFGTAGL